MSPSLLPDAVAACVILFFAARGVTRGLTGEIFSLLGMIGGVALAWKYYSTGAGFLAAYFPTVSPAVLQILVVAVLFLSGVTVASCVCRLVRAILRFSSLTFFDRILGLIVGAAKALLLLAGVLVLTASFAPDLLTTAEWARSSIAVRIGLDAWPHIERILRDRNIELPIPSLPRRDKGVLSDDNASL
jgi:membrane protein required for colicin V production